MEILVIGVADETKNWQVGAAELDRYIAYVLYLLLTIGTGIV